MELDELQNLLTADYQGLIDSLSRLEADADKNIRTYQEQYDPKQHRIADKNLRPDKVVKVDDEKGEPKDTLLVETARLPIPIQKRIVKLAAAFLCGRPIELECTPNGQPETDLLTVMKRTWEENKLDYYSKRLAQLMMAETKVAEVWYSEPVDDNYWDGTPNQGSKFRMRMKILAYKFGDQLFPVFNANGDMIAFGRRYALLVGTSRVDHFDLYTDTKTYLGTKGIDERDWSIKVELNPVGKIPVIYYNQEVPEWYDVQEMVERMEKLISNLADTNDYNGSPLLIIKGKILSFAKKGESGKVIEIEGETGSAEYLSWDQLPESTKLEHDQLSRWIYQMTSTPDISFETMKSVGTLSGFAIQLLFLDAHLKASEKEETFGIGIQRRINFLKAAMARVNTVMEVPSKTLSIKPKFEYYLPKDDKERMDILSEAVGGGKIMSKKTAVALNPLVKNPEQELENMQEEADQAQQMINNNPSIGFQQ